MSLTRMIKTAAISGALISPALMADLPSLTVHVTDAVPSEGTIEVTLFNSAETYMTEVHLQESGTPDDQGQFSARFAALEEGEYAVVVVHDENNNESYDAGILGFGKEGLGYSNNVSNWFTRPTFEDVKITVQDADTEITIQLR